VSVYSEVSEAGASVSEGVFEALSQWATQGAEAVANLDPLKEVVEQIVEKVKEHYPEAKFDFGIGQDGEGWQLTVYLDAPASWDIMDLVRPLLTERSEEHLGLHVIPAGLEEAEGEG